MNKVSGINQTKGYKIMHWKFYKHPKFYDWYMGKMAGWIEAYREKELVQVLDQCIADHVVLDIGCGTGTNSILLGKRYPNARIIGIDINPEFLDLAEHKIADSGTKNVTLINQDITTCVSDDIGEDPVDIAVCTLGLSVIPEWEKAIERICSILNPGGYLIVFDLYIDTQSVMGKFSNFLTTLFFGAHHDRKILDKLQDSLAEVDTIKIDVKPESKTSLFIFRGQKQQDKEQ